MSLHLNARLALGFVALLSSLSLQAAATLWIFDNSTDRLAASSGPGALRYHDPNGTGWATANTAFGKASSFGLPTMTGGDPDVMQFPACTGRQGYRVEHGGAANGPYPSAPAASARPAPAPQRSTAWSGLPRHNPHP